jgi:hypothetical protein
MIRAVFALESYLYKISFEKDGLEQVFAAISGPNESLSGTFSL